MAQCCRHEHWRSTGDGESQGEYLASIASDLQFFAVLFCGAMVCSAILLIAVFLERRSSPLTHSVFGSVPFVLAHPAVFEAAVEASRGYMMRSVSHSMGIEQWRGTLVSSWSDELYDVPYGGTEKSCGLLSALGCGPVCIPSLE